MGVNMSAPNKRKGNRKRPEESKKIHAHPKQKNTKNAKNKIKSKEEKRVEEEFRKKFLDIELSLPFPSVRDAFPPLRYIQPDHKKVICNPEKKKDVPLKHDTSCKTQKESKKIEVDCKYSRWLRRGSVVDWNLQMRRAEEFKRIFLENEQPLPSPLKADKSPAHHDTQPGNMNVVYNPKRKTVLKKDVLLKEKQKQSESTLDNIEEDCEECLAESLLNLISEGKLPARSYYKKHVSPLRLPYKKFSLPSSNKTDKSLQSAKKSYSMWLLINPTLVEEETWLQNLQIEPPMVVPMYDTSLPGFWNTYPEENEKLEMKS